MGRGHGWRKGIHRVPDARQRREFVRALLGGATVTEAARAAGVSLCALYGARARDAGFAADWDNAAARSAWAERPAAEPGAAPRFVQRRRPRFAGWRRRTFLDTLELSANTAESARAAGVSKRTVHKHLARDADLARANAAALARAYAGLERRLAREQAESAARWRAHGIVPTGEPTADFDEALRLLARWERPDGTLGRREKPGRRRVYSFEEAIAALEKKMRALGIAIADDAPGETMGSAGASFDG